MSQLAAEIVEAVLLLHDLGKSVEFIGGQLDLTPSEVTAIIKTGQIPVRQKNLFENEPEPPKKRPISCSDGVKRALKIHPAEKPNPKETASETANEIRYEKTKGSGESENGSRDSREGCGRARLEYG